MKLHEVGGAITKRLWIVIALVLVATLVAALVSQLQTPQYKVEIKLAAVPPVDPSTQVPNPLTAGVYAAAMTSIVNASVNIDVATIVSDRLAEEDIDIPPEELLRKATAIPETNTSSMKITFTDDNPARVADIANAWGDVLVLRSTKGNELFDRNYQDTLLGGTLTFTNPAVIPQKPSLPKPGLYVGLGAFVGLVLGLSLVIGIEYFDPHFRSTQEAEEVLGLTVLGILPRDKGNRASSLLPAFGQGSPTWKAYSELRSNLIFSHGENVPKSILVAAAIPYGMGPSIAANIAVSIANAGRKTLLVDCDMRDRAVSVLMGAGERPGLSGALNKGESFRDMPMNSEIDNLYLLPAGRPAPNSTDLLSLPLFEDTLWELEGPYDTTVLYGPAMADSVDAAVLATKSSASLVIIDTQICTRKAAQGAMLSFERLGVKPAGVVLANVRIKGSRRSRRAVKAGESVQPAARKEKAVAAAKPKPVAAGVPEGKPAAEGARPAVSAVRRGAETTLRPLPGKTPEREVAAVAAPGPVPGHLEAGAGARAETRNEEEGTHRVTEVVKDDFRKLGETGAPIPKHWLRALNSDKADVRESATTAITAYYRAFLRRYSIDDESVTRITVSIIKMMRREGEFSRMSEEQAQRYLQRMLVEAGARFSSGAGSGTRGADTRKPAQDGEAHAPDKSGHGSRVGDAGEEGGDNGRHEADSEERAREDESIDWE